VVLAMSADLALPRRPNGRPTAETQRRYAAEVDAFCAAVLELRSRLDFAVSSRGWCYILEEHGLAKGDFDSAERLIVACRKSGALPLDICAEDGAREFDNLDRWIDAHRPRVEARQIVDSIKSRHRYYTPFSFWEHQDCYVQMLVEKVDLKSLFGRICARFHIPIANARGWSDLNSRAAMMRRFANWQANGKTCILLYCGDHDPVGLKISESLRSNMVELSAAVGWSPDELTIDRFGLNADFIKAQGLTWIDGLETGSGKDLADPRHPDHFKPYVQDYLRQFGARKVEANALVVRPEAGRELCRQAILRYLPEDAPERYGKALERPREAVRRMVIRLLNRREPAP
jgi:hypothetical protein